jgi:putative redox protein
MHLKHRQKRIIHIYPPSAPARRERNDSSARAPGLEIHPARRQAGRMVEIQIAYEGELHCTARHGPSGVTLSTDAPVDNMGKGQSFSPTDLVATALGTCMATTMGIVAQRLQIELKGTRLVVTKEMSPAPRRIARLAATFHIPIKVTPEQQQQLENAARTCPVTRSVHPDVQLPITFHWG